MNVFLEIEEPLTGILKHVLVVDHSDSKHQNRVFSVVKDEKIFSENKEYNYTFIIKGVAHHPNIILSENEFKEFINLARQLLNLTSPGSVIVPEYPETGPNRT